MDYSNLIEVKPNVFLSKEDPEFHKKYLNYFPKDEKSLFEYANQCVEEGKGVQGVKLIKQAAALGYSPAKKQLNIAADVLEPLKFVPYKRNYYISPKILTATAIALSLLTLLFILMIVGSLL